MAARIRWDPGETTEQLGGASAFAAFFVVLCGFGFDIVSWLKFGVWETTTGWLLARYFVPEGWVISQEPWVGVRRLVGWFIDLPIYFCLPVVLGLLSWFFYSVAEDLRAHRIASQSKVGE